VRTPKRLTVIRPSRHRVAFGLADFWERRHLVYVFVWRDLRARYKQTLLGAMWAVLQPLLTMAVFTFVFKRLARVPSEGVSYPVFALSGLLPWQFFAQGVARSGNSLVYERHLLTRVFVPRVLVPLSAVLNGLPDFGVALAVSFGIMLLYGVVPRPAMLLALPFFLLVVGAALAVGLFLSPLNARFRDVSYLVPFFIQLWFFITPVAYPSTLVPERWRSLYFLNPVAGVTEGFRWALLGRTPIRTDLLITSGISISVFLLLAFLYFHWMEETFVDVV
jgi:homopolymeric O-antigen transport system permease protein